MEPIDNELLSKLGISLGHYTDGENLTGLTAFIADKGADIGIDIRGSNTGTLNIPAYGPKAAARLAHGVVLTGGSTFGLESAFGVMQFLEERKIGTDVSTGGVPGITGAVIYDIFVGTSTVPSKEKGYLAAQGASQTSYKQGNVGVGTGATTGKWFNGRKIKGGFGVGVSTFSDDLIVAAFAVTNSVGDIVNPITGKFYSDSGFTNIWPNLDNEDFTNFAGLIDLSPKNTTLVVVATNISLHKVQLMKVAEVAHDGMARAIYPVHTNQDGDVVFALSSLSGERKEPKIPKDALVDLVSLAAADATTKAINNSLLHATSIDGFPAFERLD